MLKVCHDHSPFASRTTCADVLCTFEVQTDILDPTRFELSVTQMRMNEYPISKRMDKETGVEPEEMGDGWVEVPLREGEGAKGRAKVYAVDCEMVSRYVNLVFCETLS